MKNIYIDQIIHDFDNKQIPDFYDLSIYDSDFDISRHLFKSLRIGYIKKTEVNNPNKAIYIDFGKKQFSIKAIGKVINHKKEIFKDNYSSYNSLKDVYFEIK